MRRPVIVMVDDDVTHVASFRSDEAGKLASFLRPEDYTPVPRDDQLTRSLNSVLAAARTIASELGGDTMAGAALYDEISVVRRAFQLDQE